MLRRSSRSPLTSLLRESLDAVREAQSRRIPLEAAIEERRERRAAALTRREFLGTAALAATGLVMGLPHRTRASSPSRIAVVGAGFAGLRFAHAMWTHNRLPCQVYEANTRLGGRVWTNRNYFADDQIAEQGAEFVSSEHKSARNLAKQFGLKLQTVFGGSEPCCNDTNWLDGAYYTMHQLNADLSRLQPAIDAAFRAAPVTLYNNYTDEGFELDHTSASDWLAQHTPGGLESKLGRILQTALLSEFGLEPSVQSSLNLIYQLGGPGPGGLAGTNEKYHIIGGNDQIAARMASELPPGFIQTEMSLVALALRSDGAYTCTFQRVASTLDVIADHVVLALPFEQLRKVDLSRAGFSALKMAAIAGYDLGTNAKLALQFNNRVWSTDDQLSGACNSDPRTFQLCWDGTVGQPGSMGILEDFLGGNAGGQNGFPGAAAHGPAPAVAAQSFLSNVEGPFPGATTAYTGSAWLDWWDRDPYISGSYGCYQLGNYTSFSGIEGRRERNVHFCGEQTSLRFQGFMEGALRSAEALAFQWPSR